MAKKTKTPSANARPVPRGLAQIVDKSAKHIDGKYCYGLPHYALGDKYKFNLVELGDMELFAGNEVDVEENPSWIPFAHLKDEAQFLAVSTEAPYPVGMWEHEDGKIHPVWASVDEFVGRVLDKKEKTPYEVLDKTLEKVSTLVDKDQYGDALGLLEPAIAKLPRVDTHGRDDQMARLNNLHGLALKGVKKYDLAMAAFVRSADAGDTYAELNILDMLSDVQKDPKRTIEHGLKVREDRYFDAYGRVWLSRYLGEAYLDVGEPANAEAEFKQIVDGYAISDAEKVAEARKGLEEYVEKKRPGAETAQGFLAWVKPKTYDVTPEQATTNKAWWKSLPEGMRNKLLEEVGKEGADATDENIARCLDAESLDIDEDEGTFESVDVFLRLTNLERLSFYGDPESIEPLRALPKLERLTICNDVIKDFLWPSRADRNLWKAAEACDKKGVEKALAAGANLMSRGDHGKSALHHVAMNHDIDLCVWLIGKGADPWAGDHGESNAFYFFGGEEKTKLEAAANKAGIPHADDDLYRLFEPGREPKCATFEAQTKLDLDDGVSLVAEWPKEGVKFTMEPPKKDDKLYDVMRVKYDDALVSEKVAEILRGDPNIELLPAILIDHNKKVRPEKYFFVNPLAVDCLVMEKCYPQWNHINPKKASEVAAMVIDSAKAGAVTMFRPTQLTGQPMIVSKALAEKLKAFSGVRLEYLKR